MIGQIYKNHGGLSVVINYLLTYSLLQLTAYVTLIVAYIRGELSGVALPFLFIIGLNGSAVAAASLARSSDRGYFLRRPGQRFRLARTEEDLDD